MTTFKKHPLRYKVLISFGIIALVILYLSFPQKKQLIMTPSTHEQIEFLQVENPKLTNKTKVEFALYDPECQYLQICISVPKNDRTLRYPDNFNLLIDDKNADKYSLLFHSTIWKDYTIYLLKHTPEWNKVTFEHSGQIATITE